MRLALLVALTVAATPLAVHAVDDDGDGLDDHETCLRFAGNDDELYGRCRAQVRSRVTRKARKVQTVDTPTERGATLMVAPLGILLAPPVQLAVSAESRATKSRSNVLSLNLAIQRGAIGVGVGYGVRGYATGSFTEGLFSSLVPAVALIVAAGEMGVALGATWALGYKFTFASGFSVESAATLTASRTWAGSLLDPVLAPGMTVGVGVTL